MKKWLALLTALVMVVSLAIPALAKGPEKITIESDQSGKIKITLEFDDIEQAAWALKFITEMKVKAVVRGDGDGKFRPNDPVTREEAITMAIRLMGLEEQAKTLDPKTVKLPFEDADEVSAWALGNVAMAVQKGLLSATDDELDPRKPASRLWVAVILVKAMGLDAEAAAKNTVQLTFKDAAEIPPEAIGYVAVAVERKLVNGYNDQTFKPNKPVTRAEMATLLGRTDDQLPVTPERETRTKDEVEGILLAVNADTLTLKAKGKEVTVKVAPTAGVFVEDKEATLADLKAGMEVELKLNTDGLAIFVDAEIEDDSDDDKDKSSKKDDGSLELKVTGVITAIVAASANTPASLTVKDEAGKEYILKLAVDVKIEFDDDDLTVGDLRVGDKVEVKGEDDVADKIEVKKRSAVQ